MKSKKNIFRGLLLLGVFVIFNTSSCCVDCNCELSMLEGEVWTAYLENDEWIIEPIQGAIVTLYKEAESKPFRTTTSNSDGTFNMDVSSCGNYEIQAMLLYQGVEYFSEKVKVYYRKSMEIKWVDLYIP
jgi:hypothetical protein